ncbi:metal ABC transporter permease, partial [candidate division TA06 bacterium]|nr:metal ABC transporter permease [candidate division TA06 bacterium]
SDAIGHAALTGVAIGALLSLGDPLWAMLIFSALLALSFSFLRQRTKASADTVIGLIMSFAVALGIVILSRRGGFNRYSQYLIGDILSVGPADIAKLMILLLAVAGFWIFYFNKIMLLSLSPSLAKSRRINTGLAEAVFSVMTALVVTVAIQWVGLLVINALLILPAAAARNLAGGMKQYLWLSAGFGLAASIAGLIASYYLATASGATMVLAAMGFYLLTLVLKRK